MPNVNTETGIAFGYIAANALHPDIVNDLQMDGDDVYYEDAKIEHRKELALSEEVQREACGDDYEQRSEDDLYRSALQYVVDNWDQYEQEFNDSYQPDEPIHEGTKDGVKYCTSWLGGALNVWIFESPFITHSARRASPCVPGAGILDTLDGDVTAYDVPPDWRDDE